MPVETRKKLTVLQALPALEAGGVERGTLEVAQALVRHGHRSLVVSAGGRLVEPLVNAGSEHITLALGAKSPLTLRHVFRLRRILAAEQVDILHARSRLPAWICYLAWKSLPAARRPHFVTTVHGPYTVNGYSRIMLRGERVIAISGFIRDYILTHYPDVDASRIELIHRGVAPGQFAYGYRPSAAWLSAWRERYPEFSDKFLVTLPARITRWKGQEDFLEIIEALRVRGVPAHGLLAGAPHARKRNFYRHLLTTVAQRGMTEHITFLGHRDDLKDIMAVSDVVLSLAREPEAFGRTALEALSLGIPVVAYNHGGAAEILSAVFPAGLVPPLDRAAVVTKLEEFRRRRPEVARQHPFTLDAMLQKTLGLYDSLSSSPETPPWKKS